MRKQSLPLLIDYVTDENVSEWIQALVKCKIDRVFLCGLGEFYSSESMQNAKIQRCAEIMPRLRDAGIEAGIWINGFGHGLADITMYDKKGRYQGFVGEDGSTPGDCFCPSDKAMQRDYTAFVKKIAAIKPTILMIDDDFRMSQRGYALGCFCPNHIADMCERLGENLSREELVEKIYSGGPNRYRDAYIASMHDTLISFAKMLRTAVDEICPEMRMGVAMCFDVWDTDGVDPIELARVFAGNTEPFLRANGAPYWQILSPYWNNSWGDIISTIEYNRIQSIWCKENNIECIGEGDTYPRPRYTIPANHLEIFDLALLAGGELDEMLKYMYDYRHPLGFEDGYTERHLRNEKNRSELWDIFKNKEAVGVRVFEAMKKLRDSDFGELYPGYSRDILYSFFSRAQYPLSHNGISTTYYGCDGAVAAFGENARHLPEELINRGVITDCVGAKILTERGYDAGYRGSEYKSYTLEAFPNGETIMFEKVTTCKMECDSKADVTSVFLPDNSPATYRYKNEKGQKFFVLGYDSYRTTPHLICPDYIVDYKRQRQLIEAIEWIDERPFVAKTYKHPFLYICAYRSASDGSLALGLFNVFADGIYDCEIELGEYYSDIKFVNCDGELIGNRVKIKGEIPPYSFAAFELKK